MKQLFSSLGGSGDGGAGGFFGLIAGLFGGAMADGGDTTPGRFYRVNENGPELYTVANRTYLMTGAQSGHVTPMSAGSMSGGRSAVMNMNITVPPGTTRQTAQQQAAEIMRHAQIAQVRNL